MTAVTLVMGACWAIMESVTAVLAKVLAWPSTTISSIMPFAPAPGRALSAAQAEQVPARRAMERLSLLRCIVGVPWRVKISERD